MHNGLFITRTLLNILNDPLIHKAYSQLTLEDRMIFDSVYQQKSKTLLLSYLTWLVGWQYAYFNQWGFQFLYWFTVFGGGIWGLIDLFRIPSAVTRQNKEIALEILQHIKIHSNAEPTYFNPRYAVSGPANAPPTNASRVPTPASPAWGFTDEVFPETAALSAPAAPVSVAPISERLSQFPGLVKAPQPVWLIPAGVTAAVVVLLGGGWLALHALQGSNLFQRLPAVQATSSTVPETQTIATSGKAYSASPPLSVSSGNPAIPPLTLVRPLADPVASGMSRLYDDATTMSGGDGKDCALIDPGNPTKRCKVNVSSSGQYAWGSSWCAANAAALNNFLNHATLRYELDGQPIALSQFWEGRSSTCLKRRLIVQNMPRGEAHELRLTITLDQGITDGGSRYPAGDYELILETESI